jgi:hypothetical protein
MNVIKSMITTPPNILATKQNYSRKTILFTNARDEKNMKEWVTHHLLLGFDIIYIFDHKSKIPIKNEFYNFSKKVVIERIEMNNPVKLPLMTRALKIAKRLGVDWMLYLDADEFLVLNDLIGVKQLLRKYNFAHSLGINWLMFGSSYHKKDPSGLLMENYTRSVQTLDQHVKTFVRPEYVNTISNPHYYNLIFPNKMFSLNLKNMANTPFNVWTIDYKDAPAFIAHYVYQSEESYVSRKLKLPTDSDNSFRGIDQHMHKHYNDVDNFLVRNKYAARVRHFLNIANNVTVSNEVKEQTEKQLDSVNKSGTTLQDSLNNETLQNNT